MTTQTQPKPQPKPATEADHTALVKKVEQIVKGGKK